MAGNVVENIKALGHHDIDFVTSSNIPVKTRYVDSVSNQMLMRVDVEDRCNPLEEDRFSAIFQEKYDLVVISDYNKGFITLEHIEKIINHFPSVFIDTKKPNAAWLALLLNKNSYLKLNEHEFRTAFTMEHHEQDHVLEQVIVTMGSDGAMYHHEIYPTDKVEVRDVAGAGDTFLSALATKYAETSNIDIAIKFANKCATQVVANLITNRS